MISYRYSFCTWRICRYLQRRTPVHCKSLWKTL